MNCCETTQLICSVVQIDSKIHHKNKHAYMYNSSNTQVNVHGKYMKFYSMLV